MELGKFQPNTGFHSGWGTLSFLTDMKLRVFPTPPVDVKNKTRQKNKTKQKKKPKKWELAIN